jgi:hypothetical protein
METNIVAQVEQRLDWYDRKARRAHAFFIAGRVIELLTAAAIPIIAFVPDVSRFATAGMGALIAVVAGAEQLFRFQEMWLNYRQTAEALRNELLLFEAGAGAYAALTPEPSPERLLAGRAASLIVQENSRWHALAKSAALQSTLGDRRRS